MRQRRQRRTNGAGGYVAGAILIFCGLAGMAASCSLTDPETQALLEEAHAEMQAVKAELASAAQRELATWERVEGLVSELQGLQDQLGEEGLTPEAALRINQAILETQASYQQALSQHELAKQDLREAGTHLRDLQAKNEDLGDQTGIPPWVWLALQALGLDVVFRGVPSKGAGGAMLARFSREARSHREAGRALGEPPGGKAPVSGQPL